MIHIRRRVTDQAEGCGRNSQVRIIISDASQAMHHYTDLGKQIVHFTDDSISVEVDCPCSLALFLYIQAYLRIYI